MGPLRLTDSHAIHNLYFFYILSMVFQFFSFKNTYVTWLYEKDPSKKQTKTICEKRIVQKTFSCHRAAEICGRKMAHGSGD